MTTLNILAGVDNTATLNVVDDNGDPVDFSGVTRFIATHYGDNGFTIDTSTTTGAITGNASGNIVFNYQSLTFADTITYDRDFTSTVLVNEDTEAGDDRYEVQFNADGDRCFIMTNSSVIKEYTFSTAEDVSTLSATGSTFDAGGSHVGLFVKSDGLRMWSCGQEGGPTDSLRSHTLGTAWTLSSASYDSIDVDPGIGQIDGVKFNPDGTKCYLLTAGDVLHQFTCETAWDIQTLVADSKTLTVEQGSNFEFSKDGLELYQVTDDFGSRIDLLRYDLSTAWDISTAGTSTDLGDLDFDGTSTHMGLHFGDDNFFVTNLFGDLEQYSYVETTITTPPTLVEGTYVVRLTIYSAAYPNGKDITNECCGPYLTLKICT